MYLYVLQLRTERYDIRLLSMSYMGKNKYQADGNSSQYGTYDVGPIPDFSSVDALSRGACIEFRCPGLVHDTIYKPNVPTLVEVNVLPADRLSCSIT